MQLQADDVPSSTAVIYNNDPAKQRAHEYQQTVPTAAGQPNSKFKAGASADM